MANAPTNIPDYLKKYAYLEGDITSAPLDLSMRMEQIYAALKKAGWRAQGIVDTDFSGPFGHPVPKTKTIKMFMKKEKGSFTAAEAEAVFKEALKRLNMNYSAISAYMKELDENIAQPIIAEVKADFGVYTKVAVAAAVVFLLIKLSK